MGVRITPSLFAADLPAVGEGVAFAERCGSEGLHFDVMDGHCVEEMGLNGSLLRAVASVTRLPIDLHLMVIEPGQVLMEWAVPQVRSTAIHIEQAPGVSVGHALREISALGKRPVLGIRPETGLDCVLQYLPSCLGSC